MHPFINIKTEDDGTMRSFSTGATRDTGTGKLDFEGFLHPLFLEQFAKYMNMHRLQSDGQLRDSDNWQKGIPQDICMKSLFRHFFEVWKTHRAGVECRESYHNLMAGAMGIIFNVQAYVLQDLKNPNKGMVDFDGAEPTDEMMERKIKLGVDQVLDLAKSLDYPEVVPCNCATVTMTEDAHVIHECDKAGKAEDGLIMGFGIPQYVDEWTCIECNSTNQVGDPCMCEIHQDTCAGDCTSCEGCGDTDDDDFSKSCTTCWFTRNSFDEHPCDCCEDFGNYFKNQCIDGDGATPYPVCHDCYNTPCSCGDTNVGSCKYCRFSRMTPDEHPCDCCDDECSNWSWNGGK